MATKTMAKNLISQFSQADVKMGDLKKQAKAIKKDHQLAIELWESKKYFPRMLSLLILDKKLIDPDLIHKLTTGMQEHTLDECNRLSEWFLANQLMKDKKLVALVETWQDNSSPVLRRLFWYHQARLRWTGQTPPPNSKELLDIMERSLATEEPMVQWTMNFCAGWIGVYEPKLRARCVKLGEKLGLYKEEKVPKNCTPSYLPEFIRIEVAKRAD